MKRCKEYHWLAFLQYRAKLPEADTVTLVKYFLQRKSKNDEILARVKQLRYLVQLKRDFPRDLSVPKPCQTDLMAIEEDEPEKKLKKKGMKKLKQKLEAVVTRPERKSSTEM